METPFVSMTTVSQLHFDPNLNPLRKITVIPDLRSFWFQDPGHSACIADRSEGCCKFLNCFYILMRPANGVSCGSPLRMLRGSSHKTCQRHVILCFCVWPPVLRTHCVPAFVFRAQVRSDHLLLLLRRGPQERRQYRHARRRYAHDPWR